MAGDKGAELPKPTNESNPNVVVPNRSSFLETAKKALRTLKDRGKEQAGNQAYYRNRYENLTIYEQETQGEFVTLPDPMLGENEMRNGYLYNQPGSSLDLGKVYRPWLPSSPPGNRFQEVYFRTESNNIYQLDPEGKLVNRNETAKNQEGLYGAKLDKQDLEHMKLVVGKPFIYKGGHTTKVIEVVGTSAFQENEKSEDILAAKDTLGDYQSGVLNAEGSYIAQKAGIKSNNILEDFQSKVPE